MINILFHIPKYVDTQLSGGEKTAQDFAEYLYKTGNYNVRVLVETKAHETVNNIDIYTEKDVDINHLHKWADIVYTHLGSQGRAVNMCKQFKKPILLYMHNTNGSALARSRKEIAVIYNSYFTKERIKQDFEGNKSTLIRPLFKLDTQVSNGNYITMINLNENKGGLLLKQIAEELPEFKFLAVTGGYGKQFTRQPDNVKVLEPTNNMRAVYAKTKILIMPSTYESYGRTAAEAIASGVPVLYSHTNTALEEVVGNAGEPVPVRDDVQQWCRGIRWISNNIEPYRDRTILQLEYLEAQIERDKANFDAFIKNIIFDKN